LSTSRRDPLADPLPLLRRVHAYVAYRLGSVADADDVTSETFARAVRYRDSYDREKGEPIGWLLGIAARCVEDALSPRVLLPEEPWSDGDQELEARTIERLSLAAAVSRLSSRDRELIALRYGADLTAREIGVRVNLDANAVNVALHRALTRLRSLLERGESAVRNAD
jgi:RNA polymerase sigma-70 factor, ECF subfamily